MSSHRLLSIAGATRDYDENGNTTSRAAQTQSAPTLRYGERNRFSSLENGLSQTTHTYSYNARGERVFKNVNNFAKPTRAFAYDESGRLLAELDTNSAPIQEYIWLDDLPVGLLAGGVLHHIQPDHLGSPRKVIQTSNNTAIWDWPILGNAFGEAAPNQDPDGNAAIFTLNLRFPGQYFDVETGLHYNYFRDYEPGIGRYAESDPIGLIGGVSTYGYVHSMPLQLTDRRGLSTDWGDTLGCAVGTGVGAFYGAVWGASVGVGSGLTCGPGAPGCSAAGGVSLGVAGAVGGGAVGCAAGKAMNSTSRAIVDWCTKSSKEKCYDDCYVAYEAQGMLCRAIKTAPQREMCWANAAVLLGECQRGCK